MSTLRLCVRFLCCSCHFHYPLLGSTVLQEKQHMNNWPTGFWGKLRLRDQSSLPIWQNEGSGLTSSCLDLCGKQWSLWSQPEPKVELWTTLGKDHPQTQITPPTPITWGKSGLASDQLCLIHCLWTLERWEKENTGNLITEQRAERNWTVPAPTPLAGNSWKEIVSQHPEQNPRGLVSKGRWARVALDHSDPDSVRDNNSWKSST